VGDVRWLEMDTSNCSVQRTLDLVGDRWSLLILREAFNGVRRFDDLARHLGVSESVLSRRLVALVDGGILEKHAYRPAGQRTRQEYRLTVAGLELFPVLVALMQWGDRHVADPDGGSWAVTHAGCGSPVEAVVRCPEHDLALGPSETATAPGPGARAEIGSRVARPDANEGLSRLG
jgi:DNA-binding HxlR family transcriptional regulator